jgi:hypothetical protein
MYRGGMKHTLATFQALARSNGGYFRSNEYTVLKKTYVWECKRGHLWETEARNVLAGRWCKECHNASLRDSIENMREIARKRGGECLSLKYVNTDTPLLWRCAKGHEWLNRPAKIKKGQWCRTCKGLDTGSIADMQILAEDRGGICLSTQYVNSQTPLEWECKLGHRWGARPGNIKTGNWCPECAGKRQGIEDLKVIATKRGGRLHSQAYRGMASKYKWGCKEGHSWIATANSIKNGTWCRKCNLNYGEEVCRLFLEKSLGFELPMSFPSFLTNDERGGASA